VRGRVDWCGIGGFAFVALSIIALALANPPDSHQSREKFADYYADFRGSSNEWRHLLATFVAFVAAFCFAWFLRRLCAFVSTVDSGLGAIALGGGFMTITLLVAAFVAATAVGTAVAYSDGYRIDLDTAILMSNVALFLYTAAAAGAAVMVWATSLAARRAQLLPRWLSWAGFGIAVVCLATTALDGLSFVLLLLWVLALSAFFVSRPRVESSG
jgi:hypothetical protein